MTDENKKRAGGFAAAKEGWLKLVASYPNLSGADLAVAVLLSVYLNSRSRDAWPAMATLARDTNRERSTVWRAVVRLESLGLIEVIHGRGWKKSNRYRPKLGFIDADPATMRRTTKRKKQRLRTGNSKAANSQLNGCELAALTLEEPEHDEFER